MVTGDQEQSLVAGFFYLLIQKFIPVFVF